MSELRVESLHYYPIKSCGGIEAPSAKMTELGFEHDREWMLIGQNNQFLSQRVHPNLAKIKTANIDGAIFAQAPGQDVLELPGNSEPDAEIIPIDIFKKPGSGTYAGKLAEEYFSDFLGRHARLVRLYQPRTIKAECQIEGASHRTGFADGFALHLASVASLAALNSHIDEAVTMDRFRPNIVVSGAPEYDEDTWREIQIGKLSAYVVRACDRCPIPDIHQTLGQPNPERPVSRALLASRRGVDPINNRVGKFFGQHLAHIFIPETVISTGDEITVLKRDAKPNINPL